MLPISMNVAIFLASTITILLVPSIHGCECSPPPNTAAERANDIINYSNLVVLARFTNETTYLVHSYDFPTNVDDDDDYERIPPEFDTQDTTFLVKEILFNSGDPTNPLEDSVEVQSDGSMIVHKSTCTECCGRYMSPKDIGNESSWLVLFT